MLQGTTKPLVTRTDNAVQARGCHSRAFGLPQAAKEGAKSPRHAALRTETPLVVINERLESG